MNIPASGFRDAEEFRIKLFSRSPRDIEPDLSLVRSEPFLENRALPQQALREKPAQEIDGETMIEDEADGRTRGIPPSAEEVLVREKGLQRSKKLTKLFRCTASGRGGLQLVRDTVL